MQAGHRHCPRCSLAACAQHLVGASVAKACLSEAPADQVDSVDVTQAGEQRVEAPAAGEQGGMVCARFVRLSRRVHAPGKHGMQQLLGRRLAEPYTHPPEFQAAAVEAVQQHKGGAAGRAGLRANKVCVCWAKPRHVDGDPAHGCHHVTRCRLLNVGSVLSRDEVREL